jgi:hypothetical protein
VTSTDRSEDPMDISAYRRRLEAELASDRGHEADQATEAPTDALASALDPAADPEARAAALRFAASAIGETPGLVTPLLTLIADSDQPIELRTEALVLLQEFSFRSVALPGVRPDFLATLRGLVDDPDMDLRRRVIGVLAREKDEFVQRRLLDGLEGRTPALVPAAKAIQYLGYDVHAEYFPLLRRIVAGRSSREAKKEAIRLLAADPNAIDLLVDRLRDQSEHSDLRRLCAIALQASRPDLFAEHARALVVDGAEDEQLRAVALSGLTHLTRSTPDEDPDLAGTIEQLSDDARSAQLKQASAGYLARRDR